MIARKIIYQGSLTDQTIALIFDITRKVEITGELKVVSPSQIELNLEGDPSMIKLIQHQIEHRVKEMISHKTIESVPFRYYSGFTLLR